MAVTQLQPPPFAPIEEDFRGPIVRATAKDQNRAINRLVASVGMRSSTDRARQFLEYAKSHRIKLEHLWIREDRRGKVLATVLAVPNPGRTAMVFASHPTSLAEVEPLGELIRYVCDRLLSSNVHLVQALLEPGEDLEKRAFVSGGFFELAVLSYFERALPSSLEDCPPPPLWSDGVTAVPYDKTRRDDLLRVLEASYEDTQDCPRLRGLRRCEDILDGHLRSGNFDPKFWTILKINNQSAGTLLLNPSIDGKTIELVYLGLAKIARGMGLGRQLIRHGIRQLVDRKERAIHLAVDENNTAAMSLYRQMGFERTLRRVALIRPLQRN